VILFTPKYCLEHVWSERMRCRWVYSIKGWSTVYRMSHWCGLPLVDLISHVLMCMLHLFFILIHHTRHSNTTSCLLKLNVIFWLPIFQSDSPVVKMAHNPTTEFWPVMRVGAHTCLKCLLHCIPHVERSVNHVGVLWLEKTWVMMST